MSVSGNVSVANANSPVAVVQMAQAADGTWSAIQPQLQPVVAKNTISVFGDSLSAKIARVYTLSSVSYDNNTGVLSATANTHNMLTGYIGDLVIQGSPTFNTYDTAITRTGANTFTVQLATGLGALPGGVISFMLNGTFSTAHPHAFVSADKRPHLVRNYGVPSETTTEMLARINTVASCPAQVVWIRGGTNDISSGTSFVTISANLISMVNTLVAAGKTVIWSTTPPRFGGTAAQGLTALKLARYIREQANSFNNVFLFDEWRILADPSSATGATVDGYLDSGGIHFVDRGSQLLATSLTTLYDKIYGQNNMGTVFNVSALDGYDASNNPTPDNLWDNVNLLTQTGGNVLGGGVAGTIAADMTVGTTGGIVGGAATAAFAAVTGLGFCQRLTATPTAASDTMQIYTNAGQVALAGRMTAGEWYVMGCHLRITGLTGQSITGSIESRVKINDGTNTAIALACLSPSGFATASKYQTQADISLWVESPPFPYPAGISISTIALENQITFLAAGTAVVMEVSSPYLTKTNLRNS